MRAIDRLLRNRPKAGGLSLAGKIKALFANGEQGWWYDPSNFSTLYQDSAGTTPVTAVEQPVGLQLDLSKGLVLGPEVVVNGNFDSSADWILGAGVSITGSALVFSSVGSTIGAQQTVSTYNSNSYYKITVVITSLSAGQFRVKVNAGTLVLIPASVGTHTVYVYSGTTVASGLEFLTAGTTTGTVDNISVKELPGNHRFQSTSANRPVVSARVNLLTKTEQFDDAAWTKTNVTVTANATTAPDGTTTAEQLSSSTGTWPSYIVQSVSPSTQVFSVYAKQGACRYLLMAGIQFGEFSSYFDLQDGTSTGTAGFARTITPVGNGWYRCTVSGAFISTLIGFQPNLAGSGLTPAAAGDGIYIWGADLRPTNQGVGLPAYQRVNTSTDYDSTGFPVYIKPNGSNQFMQTNSINFTATDKMTVWQGVRKLSDAASFPVIVETSIRSTSQPGSFVIHAPFLSGTASYYFNVEGTLSAAYIATTFTSPVTNVLSCGMDIAGAGIANELFPRVNAAVPTLTINGSSAGTGNFGNYPAYFYMRGGTSLPFGGHDYGSIARGAASTAAQITAGETYINSKTKAY